MPRLRAKSVSAEMLEELLEALKAIVESPTNELEDTVSSYEHTIRAFIAKAEEVTKANSKPAKPSNKGSK